MPEGIAIVLDDDQDLSASVARLLRRHGFAASTAVDPEDLLKTYRVGNADCVVSDVMMGEMDGFAFAERLRSVDPHIAIVFMTAWATIAAAVDAVRQHGGFDYLEKPIDELRLVAAVREGTAWSQARRRAAAQLASLTPREREVFDLLVQGHPNKVVADRLGLSPKTVEDHRAAVLAKTGAGGIAGLIALTR